MIGFLRGVVLTKADNRLILDVNGVGYLVAVPANVLETCAEDSPLELLVHTVVRENDISLFGFMTKIEKEVFLLLIKVKGIGPKVAMNVVGSLGAESVLICIGSEDTAGLQTVSGIGKRTAERIIVELRELVIGLARGELVQGPKSLNSASRKTSKLAARSVGLSLGIKSHGVEDAMLALEKLGVGSDRAKDAVLLAVDTHGAEADSGVLLKSALACL